MMTDYLKEQALNPKWHESWRVHDWRNYVGGKVKEIWETFTEEQKLAIAEYADEQASNENWE